MKARGFPQFINKKPLSELKNQSKNSNMNILSTNPTCRIHVMPLIFFN